MSIEQRLRRLENALDRMRRCVFCGNIGDSNHIYNLSANLVTGDNVIPHPYSSDIRWLIPINTENRTLEFADLRWDDENIYVKSDEDIMVNFVIFTQK